MPQGARTERVGEEFREILAEAILALKDPRVGFVTVTGVKVSPDLHVAWVYYTVLGDEKARAGTRAALRSAAPHLQIPVDDLDPAPCVDALLHLLHHPSQVVLLGTDDRDRDRGALP